MHGSEKETSFAFILCLFFVTSYFILPTKHDTQNYFYVSVRIATSRQKRGSVGKIHYYGGMLPDFSKMCCTIKKKYKIKNKAWKGRQKVRLHMLSFHIVIFSLNFSYFFSFFFVFGVHLMQSKIYFFRPEAFAAEIFGS